LIVYGGVERDGIAIEELIRTTGKRLVLVMYSRLGGPWLALWKEELTLDWHHAPRCCGCPVYRDPRS
jgi:hypothetical protein